MQWPFSYLLFGGKKNRTGREKIEALINLNFAGLLVAALFTPRLYFWRFDIHHDFFFLGLILSLALLLLYHLVRQGFWRCSTRDLLLLLLVLSLMPQAVTGPYRQAPINFILMITYGFLLGRLLQKHVLPVTLLGVNILQLALLFSPRTHGAPVILQPPFMSPFFNPSLLSTFLLVCIPFHLRLVRNLLNKASRPFSKGATLSAILILLICLVNCLVISANQTRACLLILAISLLFVSMYWWKGKKQYKIILSLLLFITLLTIFSFGLKRDSTAGRWQIWQITLRHIVNIPPAGLGYGTFQNHYLNWQSAWFAEETDHSA